jgi:hypothetical protein
MQVHKLGNRGNLQGKLEKDLQLQAMIKDNFLSYCAASTCNAFYAIVPNTDYLTSYDLAAFLIGCCYYLLRMILFS